MKSVYQYMIIGISAFVLFMLSNMGESNFAFGARLPNVESSGTVTASERSAGADRPSISERAMIFSEHHITDPGMNNIVASTVLVPEGWTVEGGITRPVPHFYSMPVMLDIKFIAPDGRQARQFPNFRFEFNHQQPSALFSPTLDGHMYMDLPESPGAWLMEMNRINPDPTISDLRLISEQMDPEMTRKLREQNAHIYRKIAQNRPTAMQIGFATEFDTQATVLVMQYTQGGKQLEETILMTWQYLINIVQGRVTSGQWSIGMMYSLRGPIGTDYINDPQLMAIFQSARPNPVWLREMNNYWAELARIRAKGAAERQSQAFAAHQKRMRTLNETTDIIADGWRSRGAISDQSHSNYIDSIHEVTPYKTPAGETVKLPSFYDHVYTDKDGRYILNNDPFYEPNADPRVNQQDWERIEKIRR